MQQNSRPQRVVLFLVYFSSLVEILVLLWPFAIRPFLYWSNGRLIKPPRGTRTFPKLNRRADKKSVQPLLALCVILLRLLPRKFEHADRLRIQVPTQPARDLCNTLRPRTPVRPEKSPNKCLQSHVTTFNDTVHWMWSSAFHLFTDVLYDFLNFSHCIVFFCVTKSILWLAIIIYMTVI